MDEMEKLKEENSRLTKINSVKTDLISISAHQLRTTLSAIKWILKMFTDGDVGKLTNEQDNFIKKASESNERMISLVTDLLTLNHTDNAEIPFNPTKTNITELAEHTVFEFSGETHKKGIDLIFLKPEAEIPYLNCDKEMIRVVLQNLIENAIKYSRLGDKIFLSIKHNAVTNSIEISVHDTGIGINKEDQPNIFNKLFRASNAIQKDSVGSGFGLFTTKNIVEKHNGKISFESSLGNGTTFFVVLPIS